MVLYFIPCIDDDDDDDDDDDEMRQLYIKIYSYVSIDVFNMITIHLNIIVVIYLHCLRLSMID